MKAGLAISTLGMIALIVAQSGFAYRSMGGVSGELAALLIGLALMLAGISWLIFAAGIRFAEHPHKDGKDAFPSEAGFQTREFVKDHPSQPPSMSAVVIRSIVKWSLTVCTLVLHWPLYWAIERIVRRPLKHDKPITLYQADLDLLLLALLPTAVGIYLIYRLHRAAR